MLLIYYIYIYCAKTVIILNICFSCVKKKKKKTGIILETPPSINILFGKKITNAPSLRRLHHLTSGFQRGKMCF